MKEGIVVEDMLAKLEAVVGKMEKEDITLDESIALYKEGTLLAKRCNETLAKLESEITVLKKESDNLFSEERYVHD